MESDLEHHHQKQMNSGLMRYQSAPSSYISSFLDRELYDEILNRPSSPETEQIFARFLSSTSANMTDDNIADQNLATTNRPSSPMEETVREIEQPPERRQPPPRQEQNSYSSVSETYYESQSQQNLGSRMGIDKVPHVRIGVGSGNPGLIRQSSSPAGFFSHLNVEDGYAKIGGMKDFEGGNNNNNKRKEQFHSSASKLPLPSFSLGCITPIAEFENKNFETNISDINNFRHQNKPNNYEARLPNTSWDDTATVQDNISNSKRYEYIKGTLSGSGLPETKNLDAMNRPPPLLAHHLSLPTSSAEMNSIEQFFHLQDSVPCKIRAKRGCATHPRSIAERVRRTRISERMRKLQDLVPNMDKQTNTSDMLDLAVEYIKDLQTEVKILSDNRANCSCSTMQQQ